MIMASVACMQVHVRASYEEDLAAEIAWHSGLARERSVEPKRE